jgi:hypothetical protein
VIDSLSHGLVGKVQWENAATAVAGYQDRGAAHLAPLRAKCIKVFSGWIVEVVWRFIGDSAAQQLQSYGGVRKGGADRQNGHDAEQNWSLVGKGVTENR